MKHDFVPKNFNKITHAIRGGRLTESQKEVYLFLERMSFYRKGFDVETTLTLICLSTGIYKERTIGLLKELKMHKLLTKLEINGDDVKITLKDLSVYDCKTAPTLTNAQR